MFDFQETRKWICDEWPVQEVQGKSNLAMLLHYDLKKHIKIQRDNFKAHQECFREGGKQSK